MFLTYLFLLSFLRLLSLSRSTVALTLFRHTIPFRHTHALLLYLLRSVIMRSVVIPFTSPRHSRHISSSFPRRRESRIQVYFIVSYHFYIKNRTKYKILSFLILYLGVFISGFPPSRE